MSLTVLALFWSAAAGAISLVSVRLFLGRLISRSCAFILVPLALGIASLSLNPWFGSMGFSPLIILLVISLLTGGAMLCLYLLCRRRRLRDYDHFWESVNILALLIIVVFSSSGNENAGTLLYQGLLPPPVTSSVASFYLLLPFFLLSGLLSLYSPLNPASHVTGWFSIIASMAIASSVVVTGGLFSIILIITVPYLVTRDGVSIRELHLRAMVAGLVFGLSAFAFSLLAGLPAGLGGALIVSFLLTVTGNRRRS